MRIKTTLTTLLVLASFLFQTLSIYAQQPVIVRVADDIDPMAAYAEMRRQAGISELPLLLEKLFGEDAGEAADALESGTGELLAEVTKTVAVRGAEVLEEDITKRKDRKSAGPIISPATKTTPSRSPGKKPAGKRRAFVGVPGQFHWQSLAMGFLPLALSQDKPEIKTTETDKEIKAEGTDKKSFETKDAKGTRTQKAETRYIRDGKIFGMEIKNTQVIEAVSKPDGKNFRQEMFMNWGAEVGACPDAEGVTAGKGFAKVTSKTVYTEGGETTTMTTEFDIQAKLKGFVDDQATFKHYDFEIDAYVTNSGGAEALRRNLVKEIKLNDGRYGIHLSIPGNTIEVSDGRYGGNRTPAKLGKVDGRLLTPMSDADAKNVGDAFGKMIPTIWHSANEMYKSAERHWKNYGCVEVQLKAPKTTLEPGEDVTISAETVHLQDNSKVNAEMKAEAYEGEASPTEQPARSVAEFTFTQTGESNGSFYIESVSKRGIGKGDVEFQLKKEKEETASGTWTGTIRAERKQREEREKRSGANLAENGGHVEIVTNVQLQLTGQLDRTVDATNAYIANVSGTQETVDFEYDRYKIDEGYCGPSAVPYKGPKEITRTSTTTATYAKDTRAYLEIGPGGGTITFSLPEIDGTTIHKYVHKSPCADHDRANTNEATDEGTATAGGSFSFSFPVAAGQKSIKGSITVRGEDGSTTTYSWELSRL